MSQLLQLIKKNFRLLVRNKFSYVLLFFLPMIIFLVFGSIYYNQNNYDLNVGFVKLENNLLYNKYYNRVLNSSLNLYEFESFDSCIDNLKQNRIHSCVIFPENFTISDNSVNEVHMYFDNTKPGIENIVKNSLLVELEKESFEIKMENIRNIVLVIQKTEILLNAQLNLTDEISFSLNKLEENNNKIISDLETYSKNTDFSNSGYKKANTTLSYILKDKDEFTTGSQKEIDSFEAQMKILKTEINGLNLTSSEEKEIDSIIKKIETANDNIQTQVNKFGYDYDFVQIKKDISDISKNLNDIKLKLDQINLGIKNQVKNSETYIDRLEQRNDDLISVSNYVLADIENISVSNSQVLTSPVNFVGKQIVEDKNSHINSHLPVLFTTLICILAMFFSANLVYIDKTNKAHVRNILTKVNSIKYVLANIITVTTIVFVQIGVIIWLYSLVFLRNAILIYLPKLLLIAFISIILFTLIGMIIGYLAKSQNGYYIYLVLFIFYFLIGSGKLIPLELISNKIIRNVLFYGNPYSFAEVLFRKILLFKEPLSSVYFELASIFAMVFIFVFICYLLESFQKKRFVYRASSVIKKKK